jgi:hypothetical protein
MTAPRIIDSVPTATNRCQDCKFFRANRRPNGNAALTDVNTCDYHGSEVFTTDRCVKWRPKR